MRRLDGCSARTISNKLGWPCTTTRGFIWPSRQPEPIRRTTGLRWAQILPCLEEEPSTTRSTSTTRRPLNARNNYDMANTTAIAFMIPAYACPSDPKADRVTPDLGPTNYFAVAGTGPMSNGNGNGLMFDGSRVRFADITDGLSNTSAFVESIKGSGIDTTAPAAFDLRSRTTKGEGVQLHLHRGSLRRDPCLQRHPRQPLVSREHVGGPTLNHYWPPNHKKADRAGDTNGLLSSRSYHPGGVNVLFGDGHIQFLKDSIALTTWRSLATRSGGEVIGSDQF